MKTKYAIIGILFVGICLAGYWKWLDISFSKPHEWRNLREDPSRKQTLQKVIFPSGPEENPVWFANSYSPESVSITTDRTITIDHEFEFHFDHGFSMKDFANLGGSFTPQISKPVRVRMTMPKVPKAKQFYPYAQIQWYRKYYLVDHYIDGAQDKNPARLNSNGTIDAVHDGAWEGWVDVYQGGTSKGLSQLYDVAN